MQEVSGSIPLSSTKFCTQQIWYVNDSWGYSSAGERLHGMQEVSGSTPLSSTKFQTLAAKRGFFVSAFCRFCNTVYILAVPCGECITD